jgi:hypothetical protein
LREYVSEDTKRSMLKNIFKGKEKQKEDGREVWKREGGRAEEKGKEDSHPHPRGSLLAEVSRSLCILGNGDAFWKMSV